MAGIRRTGYQRGWFSQSRLPKPVVSVGNMTVGGTGKTPFVIWLAKRLQEQGKRVAILSRGYGRKSAAAHVMVSNGTSFNAKWEEAGDEATLLAQKCPAAIVAVGHDRYRLGLWVLEQNACDCFLLDDGYQHVGLYRDLDILLFDATDAKGLNGVLPAGRLREPLSAARWADIIVFSRMEQVASVESLQAHIEQRIGRSIVPVHMEMVPSWVMHIPTADIQPFENLKQKAVLLVSGIGNPSSFRSGVVASGLNVAGEIRYPDHFAYSKKDVDAIRLTMLRREAEAVMTTEKDALKLQKYLPQDAPFWALNIEATVTQGEAALQQLLQDLFR